jgi:3-methyladenine DNA glycosylase AlkD
MPSALNDIKAALSLLADTERAAGMRAYMRHQFEFLGVPTTARRAAVVPIFRSLQGAPNHDLIALARELWLLPQREYQYVGVDLLSRFRLHLMKKELSPILELVQQKSWWDTVDALASVAGAIVRRHKDQRPMDRAIGHRDLWVRRIAMLHQLGWRGETDTARLFDYAEKLSPEPDFFIRKAIGWALRDYARHDPKAIETFLVRMDDRLSPLTRREAAKHLGFSHKK